MTPRHLLEPGRVAGAALLSAQSDDRLADMVQAGNDRAFEAIVARHKGTLLRYCSRILPDGRGDDALQQTFLNAYDALHRGTTPLSLRSWLFGIAHNVSLNILRQRGGDHAPLEAHAGTQEPAHVTHERHERVREVLAAVAALPPGQRDAILLRELEGRGHEEIARELGVTGGAARQLISRARAGVRRAAAAIFPMPLLMRLTAETAPAPTAERLAELTAAGGGVAVGKVVATAAIGGTLMGGAVAGPDLVEGDKDRRAANVAEAAPSDTEDMQDEDAGGGNGQRATGNEDASNADDDRSGSNSGGGNGQRATGNEDTSNEDTSNEQRATSNDDDDRSGSNSGPGDREAEEDDSKEDHSGAESEDDGAEGNSGPDSVDDESPEILEPDDDADNSDSGSDSSGSGSGSDDD